MTLHKVLHKFVIALKRAKLASCSQSTGENTKQRLHISSIFERKLGAQKDKERAASHYSKSAGFDEPNHSKKLQETYFYYTLSVKQQTEFCLATICTNDNQSCRRSLIASRLRSALRLCPEAVAKHP